MHPTTALYSCLTHIAKSLDVRVLHRWLKNDYGVQYPDRIIIDAKLKNRALGVAVLTHELMHLCHEIEGRFPCWDGQLKFNKRNWNMVKRVEIEASRDGQRFLKDLGVGNVYFRELDPSLRKHLERLWREEYFTDN